MEIVEDAKISAHTVLWNAFGDAIGLVSSRALLSNGKITYHTTRGNSASIASSILFAASGGLETLESYLYCMRLDIRNKDSGGICTSFLTSLLDSRKDGFA